MLLQWPSEDRLVLSFKSYTPLVIEVILLGQSGSSIVFPCLLPEFEIRN